MKRTLFLLIPVLLVSMLTAQEDYKFLSGKMQIDGTSTLHDWTANVTKIDGQASFTLANGQLTAIKNMKINMDAKSIKSEKGSGMDKNIYKALKTEQYPSMQFVLNTLVPVSGTKLTTTGSLTIAGVTKPVTLTVNIRQNAQGVWEFSGSKNLKMTDFRVEPPVVLMGTLKTGDEITVSFDVRFSALTTLSQN